MTSEGRMDPRQHEPTDRDLLAAHVESLESQIERLATFIMEKIPGEPSQSEGAIDCAIRLLSKLASPVPPPPADARAKLEQAPEPKCADCGLLYLNFPLDVVLSDADWLRVHPEGDGGLLCAACIVKRAAALPKMIIVNARLVDDDDHEAFRALKNVTLKEQASALPPHEGETPQGAK